MNIEIKIYNVSKHALILLKDTIGKVAEVEVYDKDDTFDNVAYIKIKAGQRWELQGSRKDIEAVFIFVDDRMWGVKCSDFESISVF